MKKERKWKVEEVEKKDSRKERWIVRWVCLVWVE